MRPTDADALMPLFVKKANTMKDRHGVKLGDEWLLSYNDIKDVIDNALTVDAIPNKEGYEMYNKGYMSGYERGKEERPHGEWELVHPLQENDTGDYKCSVCGWGGFVIKPTNYCPYCGAEMRVKDELKGEKE